MCKVIIKRNLIALFVVLFVMLSNLTAYAEDFTAITTNPVITKALELMTTEKTQPVLNILKGNNETNKVVTVNFARLSAISPDFMGNDAVTLITNDGRMVIYIDKSLENSPAETLVCLLAHETTHQDTISSIQEETNAWTLEATNWIEFKKQNPELTKIDETQKPLVERLNYLADLYTRAGNTSSLIKQEVMANEGYTQLAMHSPGF